MEESIVPTELWTKVTGFVAVIVVTLVVVGCGSSSNTTSAVGTSSTGGGAGTKAVSTIAVGSAGPLNNPIFSDPELKAGIESAIQAINASGGVSGHRLELKLFCNTNFNPNQELSCARQLAADKVAAVLSPAFLADPTGRAYQVLSQAGIPVVGDEGLNPIGLTNGDSFPLAGGIPVWSFGAVDNLVTAGAKRIALLVEANPASEFAGKLAQGALAAAKLKPVTVVTADPSTDPTLSSAAAKASAGGVDGIIIFSPQPDFPKAVRALKQAGYTGMISSITAIATNQTVAAMGNAANGILLTSQLALLTNAANPGVSAFLAAMHTYQPQQAVDELSESGWGATQLFAKAMTAARGFSGADTRAAMNGISTPVDTGVTAPYAVKGRLGVVKGFPRIVNPTVVFGVVKGGRLVSTATKGFVNPFTDLPTK